MREMIRDGDPAAALALNALKAREQGDRKAAARWLDEAVAKSPQGWLYALRGSLRAEWDDLPGAREDLDRALEKEDSAWLRLARARVLRRLGKLPLALGELDRVARAAPASPEPHVSAAAIHFDQARFGAALESLGKALRRGPRRADIRQQRARVRFVLNDWAGAQRDLSTAVTLSPQDEGLKERLAQVLILGGATARAERLLLGTKLRPGARELWLGYLRCRQKRWGEAARLFALAQRRGAQDELRSTARLYRWVVRLLAERRSTPDGAEDGLTVLGLGYRQPFQIGAAGLRALADCEAIYCNISDPTVGDFLGLFPAPRRMTCYRNSKGQAEKSAREVLASFKKLRRVAVVTRGHPTVFGPLALSLAARCKARGIAHRVLGAVTTFDLLPTLLERCCAQGGLQVRDSMDLDDVRPGLPLVVYRPNTRKSRGLARLLARYPRRHPCYLLPGQGERSGLIKAEIGTLGAGLERAGHSCTLFVPASRAGL